MRYSLLLWGFLVPVVCFHGDVSLALAKSQRLKLELLDLLDYLERDFPRNKKGNERRIRSWLKKTNEELRKGLESVSLAEWKYETDISDSNSNHLNEVSTQFSALKKAISEKAKGKLKLRGLSDGSRRQLRLMSRDSDPSDIEKVKELRNTQSKLEEIYAKARVVNGSEEYNMEPELTNLMAKSRDPSQLSFLWEKWRDVTGKKMSALYTKLVDLMNEGAVYNNYHDIGEFWRETEFDETPTLRRDIETLWKELRPLYIQLHAFVRKRLKNHYSKTHPEYKFPEDGTIPAHLLGNMWAQEWENIYDIVKPFPDVPEEDLDKVMKDNDYTPKSMFRTAEEFYTSLGLSKMTDDFWNNSMIERPKEKGREVQCHASAFDFYTDNKFRIKMCTEVSMEYFETIHHEMGHIEYFMSYRHQPAIYRDGANCAFHEAIGDTISLSVRTRKHLETIGLIKSDNSNSDNELRRKQDINYLMQKALFKLAFLPFGYLIDKWRWSVFDGSTKPENYNEEWWKLRLEYQGISAPVPRTATDFDPGAKFHIPANSPYICYFVSFIIQFQFYEALCDASGHQGPLHTCDYYRSRDAGDKLKSMLKLGASKHWRDAMFTLTGQREVKTNSIKRYFQPLLAWLEQENKGEKFGWQGATINWRG